MKVGAKVVRHGRYVVFQMAEVAIPRELTDSPWPASAQIAPGGPLFLPSVLAVCSIGQHAGLEHVEIMHLLFV